MKLFLLAVPTLFAFTSAVTSDETVAQEWETFKLEHNKTYGSQIEDDFRFKIFRENKVKIAKHNARFERGLVKYKVEMNPFGDMLHHEFVKKMNGFKKSRKMLGRGENAGEMSSAFLAPANVKLPDSVDWRDKGAVSEVKNQGHCGSCWSFSATGALEGQHFRKSGKLVSLSEQNLIDCSTKFGNEGCNGGLMDNAFRYIKANKGIDTEKAYPYEGEDDKCRYNPLLSGATDTGFMDIAEGDEDALQSAVATVGPISVAIDASHESFQFYSHGVYYEPECDESQLDHGVLVVGYGTSDNGTDYWIVKNSWGKKWGKNGYIFMSRNRDNNCGIASSASYPLV